MIVRRRNMQERGTANSLEGRKVLVYLIGSLGDSIVAIPALRAIRRYFAGDEIVVLQNFDPGLVTASEVIPAGLVDRFLDYRNGTGGTGKIVEFSKLLTKLRRERFDAAAYLAPSARPGPAIARDRAFFSLCGIKTLYGFRPIVPAAGRAPGLSKHEAVLKLDRLALDGIESVSSDLLPPLIEPLREDVSAVDEWLGTTRKRPDLPLISIGPGCKQQVNEWPLENFRQLGERIVEANIGELVIVGGKAEFGAGEQLAGAWGSGINAAGLFTVPRSAALLSRCSFHIGLDTGTTHLAAAAGTRCFAIYGGKNDQGLWHPLGPGHAVIYRAVACAPCRSFDCVVPGHPCMNGISHETVWEHLLEFVRRPAGDWLEVMRIG
ncbi:MAG: glycosyltransferase family 9 protein [Acidobacteria bacterium]|nr:glycosyltransferase family 9 protein [Acidobacteriota bacterium]